MSEALCGGSFKIKHLDNRKLFIKFKGIIKPGDIKSIKGEGINKGLLYIIFDIKFPEIVNDDILKLLPLNKEINKEKGDIDYDLNNI